MEQRTITGHKLPGRQKFNIVPSAKLNSNRGAAPFNAINLISVNGKKAFFK